MYRLHEKGDIAEFEYDLELIVTSDNNNINKFRKKHKECKICIIVLSQEVPVEIGEILSNAKKFIEGKNIGIRIN